MKSIGVTETHDPSFLTHNLESRLLDCNIIITKDLTYKLRKILYDNSDKCMLHYTITGLGGTIYEPEVPSWAVSLTELVNLIGCGFPREQVVLRIDPIIPNNMDQMKNIYSILSYYREFFSDGYTPRVRISMLDMYPHVKKRFQDADLELPYESFHAPKIYFEKIEQLLRQFIDDYVFESCAEDKFSDDFICKVGCVSTTDIYALNQLPQDYSLNLNKTRTGCMCLSKKQLLKVKPSRCPHECIYCFWKDDN